MSSAKILIFFCLVLVSVSIFGQRGPGGVSVETGSQSTCRIWLDASTLTTLSDGDDLTGWPDISLSAQNDVAVPPGNALPPFFRDDAANTINGFPVVTFEDNRYLKLAPSADLNLENKSYSKTIFFAFRTSTDVTSQQVIFEEGGGWRGINIYIKEGELIVGAYDLNDNGTNNNGTTTDADNTPQWGYTFVSTPIQANSTNVLTIQFKASADGVVQANDDFYIKGWLNGQVFDAMNLTDGDLTQNGNNGIGTLFAHPDDIGLGAVNGDFLDKFTDYDNQDGLYSFQGRLAELCYYNDSLFNETQRIILENYLGAKYFANFIIGDKYDHQALYGNEVMGIGQQTNSSTNRHNLSQARNPFLISASSSSIYTGNDQFFFTGHNGANLIWTGNGVPNNTNNIRRLQRIWRVDKRNFSGGINLKINTVDLPAQPAGFTKLVLLVDQSSLNFPNFTLPTTKVKEIFNTGGSTYTVDYNFADNSFYTLAWLKPEVSFAQSEASAIEGDAPPATTPFSVQVNLNYDPFPSAPPIVIDYLFVEQTTETVPTDFDFNVAAQANGLSFSGGISTKSIGFDIVNDNVADDESTETFLIILTNGSNTSSGLQIGQRDTLVFSILDDDPPPNLTFVGSGINSLENDGEAYIKVQRSGNPADMAATSSTATITRKGNPNEGTAIYDVDYTLNTTDGWTSTPANRFASIVFPAAMVASQIDSVRVSLLDDAVDEDDETINFKLTASNAAINPSSIIDFSLTIVDNDPLPQANFLTNNQTGYESVGNPFIFVELDRPSSRDVEISYTIDTLAGSATYGSDYTGAISGTMLFAPGDTLKYPTPFFVSNTDASNEPDETVVFELDNGLNGSIGPLNTHTYTIIDTSPFEWKGAAGVGKSSDNIVWIDADRMEPLGLKTAINNFSPRDIDIIRSGDDNNRAVLIDNAINGRKALSFDGNSNGNFADGYQIDNNSFINLAGFQEKKAYFFVIRPLDVPSVSVGPSTTPSSGNVRLLYEQGGNTRGIAIYLYNQRLYFHAWNDSNDGPESPWGYNAGAGNDAAKVATTVWARSAQNIVAGSNYVISCIYDNASAEPLMVWVNGEKGEMKSNIVSPNDVGRLYIHSGSVGLGFPINQCRFHFTAKDASDRTCAYSGLMAEFIKFHEPQMNEARRIILENYLSAKYNIPLFNTDTRQVFDLAHADFASSNPIFNREVAGVGRNNLGSYHGDAQGTAILRMKAPMFTSAIGFLQWGHNGENLTNTYPYSYHNAILPTGIEERSGKVWKLFEKPNGSISSADVYINFGASASAPDFNLDESLLKLLVHGNADYQDFSTATVYDVTEIRSGNVAYFQGITVFDGMYLALGNTSPINISPLPITLMNFAARLISDFVRIDWSTASEINNDHFVVERSGQNLQWETVALVAGAGNSNTRIDYIENDRDPLPGISYYRLKQVDYDGASSYSDVVSVVNTSVSDEDKVMMFPNPSRSGFVYLRIPPLFAKTPAQISIYDISGKSVWQGLYAEDSEISELQLSHLNKGIYLVHIKSDLINETKKLIIED